MHRIVAAVVLLACSVALFASPSAALDLWLGYGERRITDPSGRYYVVVRAKGGDEEGAIFEYAERAQGAAPARDATNPYYPAPPPAGSHAADVLPGDRVIAKGELPHAPLDVHVRSNGSGFVAVEKYANVGFGKSVVCVGADGRICFALELHDLFEPAGRAQFSNDNGSIWWLRGSWIDEERNALVLATETRLRLVDLDTGSVSEGSETDLVRALASPDAKAQELAIELARERSLAGLDVRLAALFGDASRPLGVRLRAALGLTASGDRRGRELFATVARDPAAGDARIFAVRHLARFLDAESAIPLLRAIVDDAQDGAWWPAIDAFAELGAPAGPALVALLKEPDATTDARTAAAHALGRMGASAALPALLDAVEVEQESVASAALQAAIAVASVPIDATLATLLARGSTQDAAIARYFTQIHHPEARTALLAALARHPADSLQARVIKEALAFQAGEGGGDR